MTISKNANSSNYDGIESDDDVEDIIKQTLMRGGTTVYTKGDKIKVTKGDMNGVKGTVISIEEGGTVNFKPINISNQFQMLSVDISILTKYFEPGDLVRVTEGKYRGDTGQVLYIEENKRVSVVLD